jgi:hypothetical protein
MERTREQRIVSAANNLQVFAVEKGPACPSGAFSVGNNLPPSVHYNLNVGRRSTPTLPDPGGIFLRQGRKPSTIMPAPAGPLVCPRGDLARSLWLRLDAVKGLGDWDVATSIDCF